MSKKITNAEIETMLEAEYDSKEDNENNTESKNDKLMTNQLSSVEKFFFISSILSALLF